MATYMIDGRLTRDAEMKNTTDKRTFLRFSVAWNRKKGVHYYDCAVFGERATKLYPYLKMGRYVIVTGEPDWNEYNGKTYETIMVDKISFVGGENAEQPKGYPFSYDGKGFRTKEELDAYKASKGMPSEVVDDLDIPF